MLPPIYEQTRLFVDEHRFDSETAHPISENKTFHPNQRNIKIKGDDVMLASLYTAINLSTCDLYKAKIKRFEHCNNTCVSDIHTYTAVNRQGTIDITETIPDWFIGYTMPLVYFVDDIALLQNNKRWKQLRNTCNDIVCDVNGEIIKFDTIEQNKKCH